MKKLIFTIFAGILLAGVIWGNLSTFTTKASTFDKKFDQQINIFSFLPTPTITPVPVFSINSFLERNKKVLSIKTTAPTPTATPVPDFCLHVPVLLYHHTQPLDTAKLLGHAQLTVDSSIFDEQMRYLVEHGYKTISAEDLVSALNSKTALPAKTVVVTIDDGYEDNYTYAFSTAKKYNIVINFMIPTGLIGNAGYMTWNHLKEMKDSPNARIYNHSWSHAALGGAPLEKIEFEVLTANKQFEEYLGIKPVIFTYPYGSFSDSAINFLRDHGFTGAFSTIQGSTQCRLQVMALQRMRIGNASLSYYGF